MAMECYYLLLDNHIQSLNHKFREKFSIKRSLYHDIILVLKDGWGDSQFKFWVYKNFKLKKISNDDVVYEIQSNLPVITHEELYMKIKECHERVDHHGRDRTWGEVKSRYAWVPIDSIKLFISLCSVCCGKKARLSSLTNGIIRLRYLTHLQINLIDMRNIPDGEYHWILHTIDYLTRFSCAYPLKSNDAQSVTDKLIQQFSLFGVPRILEFDMGREFLNKVIEDLKNTCNQLIIISDGSQHARKQQMFAYNPHLLQSAIEKWMETSSHNDWSKGLANIIYSMNTNSNPSMENTPYELVFGQKPRYGLETLNFISKQHISGVHRLEECENQTNIALTRTTSKIHESSSDSHLLSKPDSIFTKTRVTNKRQGTTLYSEEHTVYIDTDRESHNNGTDLHREDPQIPSQPEVTDTYTIPKRRKRSKDSSCEFENKLGDEPIAVHSRANK